MSANTSTLGKVVGANVKCLRQAQDSTLEDLARAVRALGIEWSVSRVVAIERGNSDPKLVTMAILARALRASLSDLVQTDAEWVDMGAVVMRAQDVRGMFAETPAPEFHSPADEMTNNEWVASRGFGSAEQMARTLGLDVATLRSMAARSGLVEERTARALDLDADVLSALSHQLWGRTLGEQRDSIAQEEDRVPADVTTELRERLRTEVKVWPREKRHPTEYPDTD